MNTEKLVTQPLASKNWSCKFSAPKSVKPGMTIVSVNAGALSSPYKGVPPLGIILTSQSSNPTQVDESTSISKVMGGGAEIVIASDTSQPKLSLAVRK